MAVLPYWIGLNPANSLKMVIKVPLIPAGGQVKLYLKREDGHAPSGDDVFVFFDDFNGSSLDTSKWAIIQSGYLIEDGYLKQPYNFSIRSISSIKADHVNFCVKLVNVSVSPSYHSLVFVSTDSGLAPSNENVYGNAKYTDCIYGGNADPTGIYWTSVRNYDYIKNFGYTDGFYRLRYDGSTVTGYQAYTSWDWGAVSSTIASQQLNVYFYIISSAGDSSYNWVDLVYVYKEIGGITASLEEVASGMYRLTVENSGGADVTDYQVWIPASDLGITSTDESWLVTDTAPASILFAKPDGSVWRHTDSGWEQVSTVTDITEDTFQTYGMSAPVEMDKATLAELTLTPTVLAYDVNEPSSATLKVVMIPPDRLIVPVDVFNLQSFESLNQINITTTGNGEARFLVSRDLNKWYKWNGTNWEIIKENGLDSSDNDDVLLVLNNGNTAEELNALTSEQIALLFNGEPDGIAFAIALSYSTPKDNICIEDIQLSVTPKAYWKDVTPTQTIYHSFTMVKVTFAEDGIYKINVVEE